MDHMHIKYTYEYDILIKIGVRTVGDIHIHHLGYIGFPRMEYVILLTYHKV